MSKPRKPTRDRSAALGSYEAEWDILDLYLHDVSLSSLLKPDEEVAVARRIQAGDEAAVHELVTRNLRFVVSVAKRYQNRGLALVDLIGEGNIGLMIAARKFDPDHGVKFISYAVWWIRQSILAGLARYGRAVRVPLNRTADLSRVIRATESLRQRLGREPMVHEVAEAVGLGADVVQSLVALNTAEVRLDAPVATDSDRAAIDRFMVSDTSPADGDAVDGFLAADVQMALGTLGPRDARVLSLYFGLDGGREHTLEEIGGMLGVTRERVRQLRDRALTRLRDGTAGPVLASYAA
jgi:RNA polymerase primary sigma factor